MTCSAFSCVSAFQPDLSSHLLPRTSCLTKDFVDLSLPEHRLSYGLRVLPTPPLFFDAGEFILIRWKNSPDISSQQRQSFFRVYPIDTMVIYLFNQSIRPTKTQLKLSAERSSEPGTIACTTTSLLHLMVGLILWNWDRRIYRTAFHLSEVSRTGDQYYNIGYSPALPLLSPWLRHWLPI